MNAWNFRWRAHNLAERTDTLLTEGQRLIERASTERLAPLMEALNCLTVAALQLRAAAAAPPTCRDCDDTGEVVYDGEASPCPICEERRFKAENAEAWTEGTLPAGAPMPAIIQTPTLPRHLREPKEDGHASD